ncbi:hypothetical protein JG688_00009446 [Phytophthora aleatoria]|uniref:DOT1 domain-containing protein n=1 Tax=Phytophthora aleatoria TaxID=2496075 RepID=A0A8J5J6M3_9STRA|nr:hypothetical protein JG688_00009446 [Phytophthora aleatoria]
MLSCDSFMRLVLFHDSRDEHRAQLRTGEQPQHHGEDVRLPARSNEATRIPQPATATQAPEGLEPLSLDALEVAPRTSRAERAVVEIFADVSRETVLGYDGRPTHLNVGEILPGGVSILLREIQIDERDKFVGTGAGLGNMIAQVVLQTKVYRAIGIESRQDVLRAGPDPMNSSPFAMTFQERAPLFCKDVRDIRLSIEAPFADATIVFWNNLLFQQRD